MTTSSSSSSSSPDGSDKPLNSIIPRDNALAAAMGKQDFLRVADARRAMWTGGFAGMGMGLGVGVLGTHLLKALGQQPKWWQGKHKSMTIMLSLAAGGFLGSMFAGTPAVRSLGDVFARHRIPQTQYDERLHQASTAAQNQDLHTGTALLESLRARQQERQKAESGQSGSEEYHADPYATSARR